MEVVRQIDYHDTKNFQSYSELFSTFKGIEEEVED